MSSIRLIECPSWEHFIRVARGDLIATKGGDRLYRGHASTAWLLSSQFERRLQDWRKIGTTVEGNDILDQGYINVLEQGYVKRFMDAATGIPNLRPSQFSINDWWILGRHHGLVTRLLDWTYSPYVAAYFAFYEFARRNFEGFEDGSMWRPITSFASGHPWPTASDEGDQVVIWALVQNEKIFKEGEFELIPERQVDFHRQRAQRGVFTRLRHDDYLDVESYLADRGLLEYLERIEVPSIETGKALKDLHLMNISHATLFPDLQGAAQEANIAPGVRIMRGGVVTSISDWEPLAPNE